MTYHLPYVKTSLHDCRSNNFMLYTDLCSVTGVKYVPLNNFHAVYHIIDYDKGLYK